MSERYDANPNSAVIGADMPHTARYLLARGFVKKGDTVVDGACGPGYGSALLAEIAGRVIGLDYADAINHRWKRDNVEFKTNFNLETEEKFPDCDTWVSLETIEHLYEPQKFLDKVTACTKRAMIFSSPNKETVGMDNEFHHTNVLLTNFRHYMNKYPDWMEYHSFIQGYCWVAIYVKRDNYSIYDPNLLGHNQWKLPL